MNRRFISIASLAAVLLTGCGAARPSKYYQLTVPGGDGDSSGGTQSISL